MPSFLWSSRDRRHTTCISRPASTASTGRCSLMTKCFEALSLALCHLPSPSEFYFLCVEYIWNVLMPAVPKWWVWTTKTRNAQKSLTNDVLNSSLWRLGTPPFQEKFFRDFRRAHTAAPLQLCYWCCCQADHARLSAHLPATASLYKRLRCSSITHTASRVAVMCLPCVCQSACSNVLSGRQCC